MIGLDGLDNVLGLPSEEERDTDTTHNLTSNISNRHEVMLEPAADTTVSCDHNRMVDLSDGGTQPLVAEEGEQKGIPPLGEARLFKQL